MRERERGFYFIDKIFTNCKCTKEKIITKYWDFILLTKFEIEEYIYIYIESLEKTYNRSIRMMLNLPLETHKYLIEHFSGQSHLRFLLYNRFISSW